MRRIGKRLPLALLSLLLMLCVSSPVLARPAKKGAGRRAAGAKKERRAERESERERERGSRRGSARERARERAERAAIVKRYPHLAAVLGGEGEEEGERYDQPGEAAEWYVKKRLPKGEKHLPTERYFDALKKVKKMKRYSSAKNRLAPSQEEAGDVDGDGVIHGDVDGDPSGVDGEFPNSTGGGGVGDGSASTSGALGTWQALGPGNIGGRTRSILIDPSNPQVMYAAAVAGGIWKTANGGAAWLPLDDFLPNIAVTCLAFDPSNTSTIYAGTGEGFFNADGVRGAGVFKTTDAGAHWTRLAATANSADFYYVHDIVVSPASPQHVYAATRTGVWRSLDGGATWTVAIVSNNANGPNGAMDLVIRTDTPTDYVFAAVGRTNAAHIWRNTDAGGAGAWTDVYSEPTMGRTSLALAPSNQSVVYAMAAMYDVPAAPAASPAYHNGLLGVFRSNSNGDAGSWTSRVRWDNPTKLNTLMLSNPIFAYSECVGAASQAMVNQGWYDNVLAVDPTNPEIVWAAGTDIFRSDDGGQNWGVASYWANAVTSPRYVHADNHVLVFHPQYNGVTNRTLFAGNDGGIFRTDNTNGAVGTTVTAVCTGVTAGSVNWTALNNGYAVTQFYHGLPYPNGASYFGGTQDNGTTRGTDAAGSNAWSRLLGGDGGYVAVNPANSNTIFAETTGLSIRRSTNNGGSFSSIASGTITTDVFPFITTFVMDPTNPNRIWIGGRHVWRTDAANAATAAGVTWTRATSTTVTSGSITAIAVAPTNPNRVIVGVASGGFKFTTAGTTATTTTVWSGLFFTPRGNGNGTISWLAFDPTNEQTVYATISSFNGAPNAQGTSVGHVFKSTNGGQSWASIDGAGANALPDIPAHVVVVDPNNNQRLYVGTDLGVFVSLDGGQNWARETTGFANVVVESMTAQNNNGVTSLFAFTHGRGAYKVTIPASCANVTPAAQAFYSPGSNGAVSVTKSAAATGQCDWTAVSNSDFITVNSGAAGTGTGSVGFTVAPNATGAARTGTLTVAGRTVNITQDAAPVATTDSATTDEDTPVNIAVLANDSDPDGDVLSVVAVTQGANGVVSINPDKTVRYAPNANYFGADSFGYTIDDGHGGQSTANVEMTVKPVNDAPVITVSPASQSVQYSDAVAPVNVSVSDVDDATTSLTLEQTSALPAGLQAVSDAPGTLTVTGIVAANAGTYNVGFKVTDPSGANANGNAQFVVNKEAAETVYTGDTAVVTAGPSVTTATFRLGAHLTQEADGAAGDITLARVTFELFKSNNMTDTPDRVVSGVAVNSAGDTLPATVDNMGADTYVVKVKVDSANGYWTASPVGMGTVNVTVGTNDQRVNGGGWVADAGSANGKSNFGFTVRNEKGTPKGNFVYVFRGADGFTYVVKNNAWQGGFLNFAGEAGTSALTRSSFKGRCNVQKVDPATGSTVQSWGNFTFTVDARDGDLLDPRQADGFAITIQDNGGAVWRQVGTSAALLALGGGNVQVKGK